MRTDSIFHASIIRYSPSLLLISVLTLISDQCVRTLINLNYASEIQPQPHNGTSTPTSLNDNLT